jgi:hypothetical protein
VSFLSRQGARRGDHFDIALSRRGIEVRRHGLPAQLMTWDRVTTWEIEEHEGDVLLTLRGSGSGAATPFVVPGWTPDELEVLMRDVTSDPVGHSPDSGGATARGVPEPVEAASDPPATTARPPAAARAPASGSDNRSAPAQPQPRAERRRRRHRTQPAWKPVVAVALLSALAAGVTLVLLQSAGVINWGFLGPVG